MKFVIERIKILKIIFLLYIFTLCIQCYDLNYEDDNQFNSYPQSDKELEEIRINIYKQATEISKNSDIYKKSINIGELPDSFPELMIKNAKKMRLDRENWKRIMLYPTAVWRMCLFPNFKTNYLQWCNQNLALSKSKIKLNGCKNNFCMVCCDNLQLNYKSIAKQTKLGMKLIFDAKYGLNNIEYIVTNEEINECRKACKENYQLDLPVILPTPPRDPALGTSINNPAYTCSDIKKWGDENAKSGQYWLDLSARGLHQVYCDLETESGGWTLFLNYAHLPGQNLILDSTKLPKNLDENSHMDLVNGGFSNEEIKELRFFCKEVFQDSKVYWHFITKSNDFIKVARSGDQHEFSAYSLLSSYVELNPPTEINGIYERRIFESMIEDIDYYGVNKYGGFTLTPFGSSNHMAYWTIRGPLAQDPKYECATSHNYNGGISAADSSPNMVHSNHMIWFRGDPPSEEKVRARLFSRFKNKS